MNLDESIAKLNQLAEAASSEELPLSQSFAAFEESVALAEKCFEELKTYKGKLTVLEDKISKLEDEND